MLKKISNLFSPIFREMTSIFRKHTVLLIGILTSLLLLVLFIFLNKVAPDLLDIHDKWLIIAGIPILVALVVGGYIRKFKGFGVELEMLLRTPVGAANLKARDAVTILAGQEKSGLDELDGISPDQKQQKLRLTFIEGGRYLGPAIDEYMRKLPNLEYFEIQTRRGKFRCLLPIGIFLEGNMNMDEFSEHVEAGEVLKHYRDIAITDTARESEGLLDILPKIRARPDGLLAVVSDEGKFVGIATSDRVEKRIADEALEAQKRA